MNMRRLICCLMACLVCVFSLIADGFTVKNLTIQKQLSSYSVMALYQDERGLIWIGTRNGVNIYDGTHIQINQSHQSDSASIINNHVLDIVGDKQGTVYLSSRQGLTAYSILSDRYETLSHKNISSMCYMHDKLFVANSRTIFTYNPQDKTFSPFYKLPETVSGIADFSISGDSLFIGTELHGLYIYNQATKQLSNPVKGVRVSKIFTDSRNKTWIGTWKNGLYTMVGDAITNYTHHDEIEGSICSNFVRTF